MPKQPKSVEPKCPPGFILRKSYTTESGKVVPARCIVDRAVVPKTGVNEEKIKSNNKKVMELCNHEKCPENCPKHKILRDGYVRESYKRQNGTVVGETVVAPECINNKGAPGKGKQLIKLNPLDRLLSTHGYEHVKNMPESKRHDVLMKVINAAKRDFGKRIALDYVIHALRARGTLTKTGSPESSARFIADQKWVSGLLEEYKVKYGDKEKKSKDKRIKIVLQGPTTHILSRHGYVDISGIPVESRHHKLRETLKELAGYYGDAGAYKRLIEELNARANLGLTKSPESSKLMKRDADWISELYKEWKKKVMEKEKKKGEKLNVKRNSKLVLGTEKKKTKIKLAKNVSHSNLAKKLKKMSK